MNHKLTNKELIRASQNYFQNCSVKKILNKYVALFTLSASVLHPEERKIIHDVDILCFKKRGVPVGKLLTELTKLVKGFSKLILNKYSVNVTAFPNFTLQAGERETVLQPFNKT